jgi:hypothetical protein
MKNLLNRLTEFAKMNFKLFLFVFITASMICVSCKPKHVKSTVQSIDSLLVVLNNCEINLKENNIDTIEFFNRFLKNDTDLFKSTEFDFPENKELKKVFGNYTTVGKVFKRMSGTKLDLVRDITLTKTQLDNLKYDLNKGLITNKDTIQMYYTLEKDAVVNIEVVTNSLINRLNSNMEYFYEINPVMDKFKEEVQSFFPDKEFSKLHYETIE